jgi:hypothetical protein
MQEASTTPDLLETARRFVEAFNRHDWDAVLAGFTSDAIPELSPGGFGSLEMRSLAGHGEPRAAAERLAEERV